jgi:beta-mannosidase
VQEEITYQARRLQHHASLAIWGGGNEVEASFRWFPDSRDDPQGFTDDYMRLFVYTIRTAIMDVDPSVAFVDSSPSNQIKSVDPYSKRWALRSCSETLAASRSHQC